MLNRERNDRALPTLVTLLVIGVLLMTFDVRLEGGGVVGTLRTGTQTLIAPVQKVASKVVNPVADLIESLADVGRLREKNEILEAELAEANAALVAVQDELARLEILEQINGLDLDEAAIGSTVANVIGSADALDEGIIIDKGTRDGVIAGQPVVDPNGYVVGRIKDASLFTAILVPITVSRSGIAVLVGTQVGSLTPQPFRPELRLNIPDAREPVLASDRVVTSSASSAYPAGLAVGEVVADARPQNGSLAAEVRPFVQTDSLRFVIVLSWPPDPVSGAQVAPADTTTLPVQTTTTLPATSTTEGG